MNPSGKTDNWFTPLQVFEEHQKRTGWHYRLDVAGHPEAPVTRKICCWLPDALAESNQWLAQEPWGAIWCNPPYSDIAPWVAKAIGQVAQHGLRVTMLLPSWTDRTWWQANIEPRRDRRGHIGAVECKTLHLPRFKFGYPGDITGKHGRSPTFGCVLVDFWRFDV